GLSGIGVLKIDRILGIQAIVQTPETHQRIVFLIELALLAENVLRNDDVPGRLIELHRIGYVHQVLFRRAEEKQLVIPDRPAQRSAKLVLQIAAAVIAERIW